jgi:hypothetical protein
MQSDDLNHKLLKMDLDTKESVKVSIIGLIKKKVIIQSESDD